MDYKRNRRYFESISWKGAIISIIIGLILLSAYAPLGVIILIAAGAYLYFKIKGRPTDGEIDAIIQKQADIALQKGYDKLGVDPDEVNLIDPIVIHGPMFQRIRLPYLTKKGKDEYVRSSNHEIMVFFFSEQQVYFYNYSFSIIDDEINEGTDEYFYRDVVSVSTSSTTTTYTDSRTKKEETFSLEVFKLTTSGATSMTCAIQDSNSVQNQIRGMKNLLREKKSA
ncbi:hypothetical protein [Lederbergia citrea]|uniref:Uncharacterized protein n=1 Tax=Lederbergia citrea TaxID=2833581 RepID=A0A942UQW9_9BACI|nr:hypothetical protein [Lederbergia citrea]MBS4223178.1 hypothetical protein [Lederbergia citrea]